MVLVVGATLVVARVAAGVAAGGEMGRVMPVAVAVAVRSRGVPVMEAEQSHRSQPGSTEGECEGVGVHGDDNPIEWGVCESYSRDRVCTRRGSVSVPSKVSAYVP